MTAPLSTRTIDGVELPAPGTYSLDPNHVTVGFVARHLVVAKVRGSFRSVAGTITVAEDPQLSTVDVTIDAASIDTGQSDRDKHLRSADFLDVANFPTLTFRGTRVQRRRADHFVVLGDLTIRGTTRPVELAVDFEGVARSPYGHDLFAITATTEIDREAFGLTWNQVLETGGVAVGKIIKIEITAEAVRQA